MRIFRAAVGPTTSFRIRVRLDKAPRQIPLPALLGEPLGGQGLEMRRFWSICPRVNISPPHAASHSRRSGRIPKQPVEGTITVHFAACRAAPTYAGSH